jgi:competence protein ComEA
MSGKAVVMQTRKSSVRFWIIGAVLLPILLLINTTRSQAKSGKPAPVNINSADIQTLEKLPGITPTTARKIIDGRPYHNSAQLQKATGLSNAKLKELKGSIKFGPATTTTTHEQGSTTTKKTHSHSETQTQTSIAETPTPTTQTKSSRGNTESQELTPTGSSSSHGTKLAPGQTVNINTASLEQFEALPGIGPAKGQAIIDYRNEHGQFNSIEEIKGVKGIKEGEFGKLKDYIRVK